MSPNEWRRSHAPTIRLTAEQRDDVRKAVTDRLNGI
jgi:hypothetical protein